MTGAAVGAPLAVGAGATLADGLTIAAGSSKLLRDASIYIGLLMLALAGPGVVAGLSLLGWEATVDPTVTLDDDAAAAAARAALLIAMAFVGAIIVVVEGSAVGIALVGGRVLGRPIALRNALGRSRRVFWRIVRAGLIVGGVQATASHLWQVALGQASFGDLEGLTSEPIPSAIATLPLLYATVAIVLADDGARAGLRRSARIARSAPKLTIALAAFALISGVVQTFALSSALDLIVRLTGALDLDITAGGASFAVAALLALAVVMAAGSLLFTVSAVVVAPQVVAWARLGLPTNGLAAAADAPGLPTVAAPETGPLPPEPTRELAAAAEAVARAEAAPDPAPAPTDGAVATADAAAADNAATPSAWGAPGSSAPSSAWAAAAAREAPFRWVTIPMLLTIAAMWLIAGASLVAGLPT